MQPDQLGARLYENQGSGQYFFQMAAISFPYGAFLIRCPGLWANRIALQSREGFICVRQAKKARPLFEIGLVNLKSGGDLISPTVFVLIFASHFCLNRH